MGVGKCGVWRGVWEGACCMAGAGTEGKLQLEVEIRAVRGEHFGLSNPQHPAALAFTKSFVPVADAYCLRLPPHSLPRQVDLAREASNLQRFNYNFRRTDHVRFPVPLYPLVSADVLVRPGKGWRANGTQQKEAGCSSSRRGRQVAAVAGAGGRLQGNVGDEGHAAAPEGKWQLQ